MRWHEELNKTEEGDPPFAPARGVARSLLPVEKLANEPPSLPAREVARVAWGFVLTDANDIEDAEGLPDLPGWDGVNGGAASAVITAKYAIVGSASKRRLLTSRSKHNERE